MADRDSRPEANRRGEAAVVAPPAGPATAGASALSVGLRVLAQVVGVAGVLLCLGLGVASLVLRARVIDRVDAVAARLDGAIAKGGPLLAAARERVGVAIAAVRDAVEALRSRADDPGLASERAQALLERTRAMADRWLGVRAAYDEAHERITSALERLDDVAATLPVTLPTGLLDARRALDALDDRLRSLDATWSEFVDGLPKVGTGAVADAVADALSKKADRIVDALDATKVGLFDLATRLDRLRAAASERADGVRSLVTASTVVLIAVLLYAALLHAALWDWGRRGRRTPGR